MSGTDLLGFSFDDVSARDISDKSPTALRTISEVSDQLDVPQHVLRFWETKFPQIVPLKRGGGRRFYRPQDIEVLQQVKFLLYKQGYTIKGAKKAIEDYARVLASTEIDVGSLNPENAMPPANMNDNTQTASRAQESESAASALEHSALASIRAELVEARKQLAMKLGVAPA